MTDVSGVLLAEQLARFVVVYNSVPRGQREIEGALSRKLSTVFSRAFAEFRDELDPSRVPESAVLRAGILAPFYGLEDDLAAVISEEKVRVARYGAQRAQGAWRRRGRKTGFGGLDEKILRRIRWDGEDAARVVMARIRREFDKMLRDASASGLAPEDLEKLVEEKVRRVLGTEVERISETEINASESEGAYEAMRSLGVEYVRWVDSHDHKVRGTHRLMDGEIAPLGVRFSNGCLFPGDKTTRLGPKEWIRCRCHLVPFVIPAGKLPPLRRGPFRESDLVRAEGAA